MAKKTLNELVFHDDFMFTAVMTDEENCRCFLERVLDIPIERVELSKEHGLVFNPESKGIRMDVYAKDEHNTHYDIEMQLTKKDNLERRSRYYHSQMDMEMLAKGKQYRDLPDAYVIFICNFDPLGERKCRYTIHRHCQETDKIIEDGVCAVFLNTQGENRNEVPKELVALLDYVKADLTDSEADYGDPFVKQLQNSVRQVKANRRMGERYMMFEQYMQEYIEEHADEIRGEAWADGMEKGLAEGMEKGLAEGMAEGLAEGLAEGQKAGVARVNKLSSLLLSADRLSDLRRALQNPEYQEQLFREFNI